MVIRDLYCIFVTYLEDVLIKIKTKNLLNLIKTHYDKSF